MGWRRQKSAQYPYYNKEKNHNLYSTVFAEGYVSDAHHPFANA
jgi:hypothetical protein